MAPYCLRCYGRTSATIGGPPPFGSARAHWFCHGLEASRGILPTSWPSPRMDEALPIVTPIYSVQGIKVDLGQGRIVLTWKMRGRCDPRGSSKTSGERDEPETSRRRARASPRGKHRVETGRRSVATPKIAGESNIHRVGPRRCFVDWPVPMASLRSCSGRDQVRTVLLETF
jgi:hypothetical protein